MAISKKCTCGLNKKISCKNCSKVVMKIMLKNGNKHLKETDSNGRKVNPAWYSQLKKNNKPFSGADDSFILQGMIKRFKNSKYFGNTNVLMFYSNGILLHKEYV